MAGFPERYLLQVILEAANNWSGDIRRCCGLPCRKVAFQGCFHLLHFRTKEFVESSGEFRRRVCERAASTEKKLAAVNPGGRLPICRTGFQFEGVRRQKTREGTRSCLWNGGRAQKCARARTVYEDLLPPAGTRPCRMLFSPISELRRGALP
jgi:hypothetical protein